MAETVERWPDFLAIGAPKAGTTALFRAIARHPEVSLPAAKEPRYFTSPGKRPSFPGPGGKESADSVIHDRHEYLELFKKCSGSQKIGDGSTGYLYHPAASANCYSQVPTARLIAVLRQPVSRAYSQWLHLRHKGVEDIEDFETALAAESRRIESGWRSGWHYQRSGFYGEQLQRWLSYYPREQLLILFHEDWIARPAETLAQVFRHIGVNETISVAVTRENVSSRSPRWTWLHHQMMNSSLPRSLAQKYLPLWGRDAITRLIGVFNLKAGPRLDPELRSRLSVAYHDDIDVIESITGRDLSHWRGAA